MARGPSDLMCLKQVLTHTPSTLRRHYRLLKSSRQHLGISHPRKLAPSPRLHSSKKSRQALTSIRKPTAATTLPGPLASLAWIIAIAALVSLYFYLYPVQPFPTKSQSDSKNVNQIMWLCCSKPQWHHIAWRIKIQSLYDVLQDSTNPAPVSSSTLSPLLSSHYTPASLASWLFLKHSILWPPAPCSYST